MEFVILFFRWFLFGGAVLAATWLLTRDRRRTWLTQLLRAAAAAIAFTPTLARLENADGLWPMPAGWVLFSAVLEETRDQVWADVLCGGGPLAAVTILLWWVMFSLSHRPEKPKDPGAE